MKKRLLALCVASALTAAAGTASAMQIEADGIGMYNILPYYSVQAGNATLIAITNTDLDNGKAVKIRFRGAEWSDDVFDFTLFLSPGDQWTGAITANGTLASMNTTDNSCTLPADINRDFLTFRLVTPSDQDAPSPAGTREGYVEIITMADIPMPPGYDLLPESDKVETLYGAIKHVDGVAPCTSSVLVGLVPDNGTTTTDPDQGMDIPTPSLMAYAITINVPDSKAFAYPATALNPTSTIANKIYFTQSNIEILADDAALEADLTDDRIFYTTANEGTNLPIYQFDLPDLTTPITGGTAIEQRDLMTTALATSVGGAGVEYVTADEILATTDVVFTQPTRRFYYRYAERVDAATGDYLINDAYYDISATANPYVTLDGSTNRIAVGSPVFFDREETTITGSDDIVISPTPPNVGLTFSLKGEASVISINNGAIPTGSLSASLTANNYETTLAAPDGWAILSTTTSDDQLLPMIGFTAINAFNSAVAGGTNYGYTLPLRGR